MADKTPALYVATATLPVQNLQGPLPLFRETDKPETLVTAPALRQGHGHI